MSTRNGNSSLFSIDVEAHLKKAASHTFGSPSHYPVELVRAALRRGAKRVDVNIRFDRIQVTDDGAGMDRAAIDTLRALLDSSQPTAVKEAAVESVQSPGDYGLLALFAAAPSKIRVENVSVLGKTHFLFQDGKLSKLYACDLIAGTRITLSIRMYRDISREKQVLSAYCRSVSREIRLNNRLISKQPLLSHQLTMVNLTASKVIPEGAIGIPSTGDLCRIRLLDLGIPYRHVTLPPYKGFIFEAVIEYIDTTSNGEISRILLNHLTDYALQLYQWLTRHYAEAAPDIRNRIEELVFTHSRLTDESEGAALLNHFSLFRMFRSSQTLSFPQIVRHFGNSLVYAVPRHKERQRYNITGKTVLSLTREHADFLINHKKLPVTFLPPVLQRERYFAKFLYSLKRQFKAFIRSILPTPSEGKYLPVEQLSSPEQTFIKTMNEYLSTTAKVQTSRTQSVRAVVISSGGLFPSIPPKKGKNNEGTRQHLLIRRHHPLVRKAVRAVETDPANMELFIPLLIR
jgi:hypothetical protein